MEIVTKLKQLSRSKFNILTKTNSNQPINGDLNVVAHKLAAWASLFATWGPVPSSIPFASRPRKEINRSKP
jgi:hypothetical protein